jgi:hypothetical protein
MQTSCHFFAPDTAAIYTIPRFREPAAQAQANCKAFKTDVIDAGGASQHSPVATGTGLSTSRNPAIGRVLGQDHRGNGRRKARVMPCGTIPFASARSLTASDAIPHP